MRCGGTEVVIILAVDEEGFHRRGVERNGEQQGKAGDKCFHGSSICRSITTDKNRLCPSTQGGIEPSSPVTVGGAAPTFVVPWGLREHIAVPARVPGSLPESFASERNFAR